ncbi:MAG: hypothetical protein M3O90_02250 [Actinomycetota bacterium]|nr:hypothetical protein [Actinomycetota bacterium]
MREAPNPPFVRGASTEGLAYFAGEALGPERPGHVAVALYSTRSGGADRTSFSRARALGRPFAELFPPGMYRRFFEYSEDQLPRIAGASPIGAGGLQLPSCGEALRLQTGWTCLFRLSNGACVGALWLRYELLDDADQTRPLPELFRVIDAGRHEAVIDGETLEQHLRRHSGLDDLELGLDFHSLLLLPDGAWISAPDLDRQSAQRIVSRRKLHAFESLVAQRVTSVDPGDTRHLEDVAPASRELGELELELSFGVEAFLDIRLLIPSLPVQQFHTELTQALALPESARVTASMVTRLSRAITAERTAMQAEQEQVARNAEQAASAERLRADARSRAFANAAALLAAVTIPGTLILAFLGVNVIEVDPSTSLTNSRYWLWYLGLVAVPAAIVYAALAAWDRRAAVTLTAGMRFIAHRFGRSYGPDSSAQALDRVLSEPLFGLETDCCLTRDDELVLLHDPWLPGATTLEGWVRDRSVNEITAGRLRAADGSPTGEQPMLLGELLARDLPTELLQLEVKATADPALAARTADALCSRVDGLPGVEVISFWPEACVIAADRGLNSRLIVACAYLPAQLASWAAESGITGIVLEGDYFDPRVIEALRAQGLSVISGVVNDPALLWRVAALAPDAVCSDRPHELAREAVTA